MQSTLARAFTVCNLANNKNKIENDAGMVALRQSRGHEQMKKITRGPQEWGVKLHGAAWCARPGKRGASSIKAYGRP